MRQAAAVLFASLVLLTAAPAGVSAQTPSGRWFASHKIVAANPWWLGPATMEYVVKGTATEVTNESGTFLAIKGFSVKVQLTPERSFPYYVFVNFRDEEVSNRTFRATYDEAAGVYRVRADATFWFPSRDIEGHDIYWVAGWTGIMLTYTPGGPIRVTPLTDAYEDWWFL